MRLDKFSLISMETIDYQLKDPVIDNMRNIIEEYKQNKDGKQFAKDLIEIVNSKEFDEIIDKEFKGFDKPSK